MTTLAVVDDPTIEVAVLIDTDSYTALPVVAMGPQRVELLREFASSPVDLAWFTREGLLEMWMVFLQGHGIVAQEVETNSDHSGEVVTPARDGTDDGTALAEAEATNASDTPAPAPADTDQATDQEATALTVRCWNCEGTGMVTFGDDEPPAQCGICNGTGKVTQMVQS